MSKKYVPTAKDAAEITKLQHQLRKKSIQLWQSAKDENEKLRAIIHMYEEKTKITVDELLNALKSF